MKITRTNIILRNDHKRVLLRPFIIPDERINKILLRISKLTDDEVKNEVNKILINFERRHKNAKEFFLKRFDEIKRKSNIQQSGPERNLLTGAYFTLEYSLESVALFNPSMVWHPDQPISSSGTKKFILSLRATGEGHISSITFRTGVVDSGNNIFFDIPNRFVRTADRILRSGDSGYNIEFQADTELSERIIFPFSSTESNGIEDARFVEFNDDGKKNYFATYTAYDGKSIIPGILETKDFLQFQIKTLRGSEAINKGFALFPRKITGKYAMLSRQDNENNFIMFSDNLYEWNSKQIIQKPKFSWEFIQLGNCGSPIETEAGWLVLSHGVGAMREYSIGAFLLDKEDPSIVIGRLEEPLLAPNENEREGYVPNVVYSCGSIIHGDELIIPYAMSDYASSIAKVNLNDLLTELTLVKNKV